jgi:CotH protein/VTC domain-containing protein
MPPSPSRVAEAFPALGLAELDDVAALRERVDTKYVIGLAELARLADLLRDTHAVLEIDGRRAFRYRTTYFDTAELRMFRDHVQERRRRFKCRSREYVDSGLCTFEVKLKGLRGRTVKHRMAYDRAWRDRLSEPALAFLRECVERSYGRAPDGELRPALVVAYTRVTFAAPALGERLTCDFDLAFTAPDGASGRLADDAVIVESKSARGNAVADRALRTLGARPEGVCSKYCLGVGFTNPRVKSNRLRPLLRRHFRAAPVAAVGLALAAAAPAAADVPGASAAAADVPRLHLRSSKAIRDEPKVPARLSVGGRTYRVEAEWRGQASQLYPKKSYAIEAERRVRLLGMPAERDWVLNAAYADPSLLRDVVAHAAARRLGLPASRTRPVELRLNGRRRGVYVLMEQPELSRHRLRGEALLELTEPRKLDRGDDSFPSATGLSVRHVEPDEADKKNAVAARRALEALERALGGPDWRAHLDERSAVDYVLHAELLGNQDTFHASTFVYLRRDGRLAMGPVWDFDLSAGNVVEPVLARADGWMLANRPWAAALHADPAFRAALAVRWRDVRARGLVEALQRAIDRHARALRAPARRNFTRWPTLGTQVFRNQVVQPSHAAAVAALKDWLVRRSAWMDAAL